jgi:hypothetical protein
MRPEDRKSGSPDEQEDPPERAGPRDVPDPEPGVTAPLDHVTDDERDLGPVGVMPGAGPEVPDKEPGIGPEEADRPEPGSAGPAPDEDTSEESEPDVGPEEREPDSG